MIVLDSGKRRRFTTVAFSGDAGQLAAGGHSDKTIVWDLATGRELHRIKRLIDSPTQALAFHPRTPWLYIPTRSGVTAFNTATGDTRQLWHQDEFVRTLALDPTTCRLVGVGHSMKVRDDSRSRLLCISVADPDNPVTAWEQWEVTSEGWCRLLAFLPDGERFISVEIRLIPDEIVRSVARLAIHSAATGQALQRVDGVSDDPDLIAVSPAGETVVTTISHRLFVFDLTDPPAEARAIENDSKHHFTGLAFHPSGQYLAVTSSNTTVKLFDTATWQLARTFTWNIGRMRSIAFSPDGTLAAAGSDSGKVVVWDVDV